MIRCRFGETIWWSNTKGRMRQDTLFGFVRYYSRNHRKYVYQLVIWRFLVGIIL